MECLFFACRLAAIKASALSQCRSHRIVKMMVRWLPSLSFLNCGTHRHENCFDIPYRLSVEERRKNQNRFRWTATSKSCRSRLPGRSQRRPAGIRTMQASRADCGLSSKRIGDTQTPASGSNLPGIASKATTEGTRVLPRRSGNARLRPALIHRVKAGTTFALLILILSAVAVRRWPGPSLRLPHRLGNGPDHRRLIVAFLLSAAPCGSSALRPQGRSLFLNAVSRGLRAESSADRGWLA